MSLVHDLETARIQANLIQHWAKFGQTLMGDVLAIEQYRQWQKRGSWDLDSQELMELDWYAAYAADRDAAAQHKDCQTCGAKAGRRCIVTFKGYTAQRSSHGMRVYGA